MGTGMPDTSWEQASDDQQMIRMDARIMDRPSGIDQRYCEIKRRYALENHFRENANISAKGRFLYRSML